MQDVLGFGLSAGQGVRLQPLTMKASGYIRAKAAVRFLGDRIITWMLRSLRDQGMEDVLMITRGKENRCQVKSCIGYGEHVGMRIQYSPQAFTAKDTGSAGAVLDNVMYADPTQKTIFVFPTDSLLEFDLSDMVQYHRRTGAAVTIGTAAYAPEEIAGQYGLLETDAQGRVLSFLEKPTLERITAQCGPASLLPTNAGFYLMDTRALQEMARTLMLAHHRTRPLDIGGDLLPWMVACGYTVQSYPISRMGDLGNIPSYLKTMGDALHGAFPSVLPYLPYCAQQAERLYIDQTSWEMTDAITHLSLREKVARGMVTLHAPVRIGKFVTIEPGVTISGSNLDDECVIRRDASIVRSSVGESALIGPSSRLCDAVVGMMSTLRSTPTHPITLSGHAAVGDEVLLNPGVELRGRISVFPRISIPRGVRVDSPMTIASDEDVPSMPTPPTSRRFHAPHVYSHFA